MSENAMRPAGSLGNGRGRRGARNKQKKRTASATQGLLVLDCPACSTGTLRVQPGHTVRSVWVCSRCGGGSALHDEIEAATGVPRWRYLDAPYALGLPVRSGRANRKPAPLPSPADLRVMRQRLKRSPDVLKMMGRDGWGFSPDTITLAALGLTEAGEVAFPVFADGHLRQFVVRARDGREPKYRSRAGHGAHWYPAPPEGKTVLLAAGMKDALIARQNRCNAVSTTCGTSLPQRFLDHLAANVERRVDVCYDVGEGAVAEKNARRIRAVGLKSSVVELPMARDGADLVDWFREAGTAQDLKHVIRRARRS